ncbi:MAG: phosphoglycerate dehydrogenase [Planctomycetota bacterium]|jgi:D-3-phosphoglycerate dehydrogenase
MPHILVADKIADAGVEVLANADGFTFDVKHGLAPDALAEVIGSYDGILIRSAVRINRETLANPGNLSAIARAGVGVDNVDIEAATEAGVLVLNTPDANTISTAEHTIAMILALHRRIPDAHQHVRGKEWKRSDFQGKQVAGRRLGIVGFGRIGRAVAQRALALEMEVIAYDPFVAGESAYDGKVKLTKHLPELLGTVDCLTLHTSLSDDTRSMIGKDELAQMKTGSRLINCARGALIDEVALADSLNSDHLAGAALDVYEKEPPTGSPILEAKNVVLTPHLAASTSEAQRQVSVDAAESLVAYLRDGEIRAAVNVAGMPGSLSPRARAFVDLCARMGALLSVWAQDGVQRIAVTVCGDSLEDLAPTLSLQAMAAVVGPHLSGRLNLVNAKEQAKRRGISVEHSSRSVAPDRPESILVAVESASGGHEIEGTVLTDRQPRILSIDGYRMEMVPEGSITMIFNDDRPGVIGLVGQMCGEADLNIADMALSRHGDQALMVLKLDEPMPEQLRESLRALNPPIRSVRGVTLPAITV